MGDGIAFERIRPSDCAIAFGIPTTEAAFWDALDDHSNREFVPAVCRGIWTRYANDVVRHLDIVLPDLANRGVTVCRDLTPKVFSNLLENPRFRAVILFAHCRPDAIEFSDSLKAIAEVLELIPPDFDRILDLCGCESKELLRRVKGARHHCLVKGTNEALTPVVWIYFYQILFQNLGLAALANTPMTYLEAFENSARQMMKC